MSGVTDANNAAAQRQDMPDADGLLSDSAMSVGVAVTNGIGNAGAESHGMQQDSNEVMLDLRKYLLLLAILAATVTYVAGLNPPGGFWPDTRDGHLTGNQILVVTYHARYNAFSYSNAAAFMASGVVILLLVFAVKDKNQPQGSAWCSTLRLVMALDMLALVVAYAAGASRDWLTTILAAVLVSPLFIYVLLHTLMDPTISSRRLSINSPSSFLRDNGYRHRRDELIKRKKKQRGILMLLAIFAATITYTAGLNPPGGFWPDTRPDGHHRAGDPVLNYRHRRRFVAFFVCNTVSFVASLIAVMLLLTNNFCSKILLFLSGGRGAGAVKFVPQAFIWISLLNLLVEFAAGSCREKASTAAVLVPYLVAILVVYYFGWLRQQRDDSGGDNNDNNNTTTAPTIQNSVDGAHGALNNVDTGDNLKKARSLILLLATLAASVTFQAGLNPPGGFWSDDRGGHNGGDPILLTKHTTRYKLFFYSNSLAFATSLFVIFMVEGNYLSISTRRRSDWRALWMVFVMILDLIALIVAFAAGCCRNEDTSVHVMAMAGGTLIYVVLHMIFFTMHRPHEDLHRASPAVERKRKRLLLITILAVTRTYQAGLTPPGGFWDGGAAAGDPVLSSTYALRYKAFFYLNATAFMVSVALTVLLVNSNLYTAGIRCHALHVCMVASLFALLGAYAAGSSRHLRTTIVMIALIAGVFAFVLPLFIIVLRNQPATDNNAEAGYGNTTTGDEISTEDRNGTANGDTTTGDHRNGTANGGEMVATSTEDDVEADGELGLHAQRKYLMILGILAASVTYQAGLAPPGGVWPDNSDGHAVGDPVLRDINHRRYLFFFLCNSVSFVASVVVITLQLLVKHDSQPTEEAKLLIKAAHWAMVLDLAGLLGAYAAGSTREWETSGKMVALLLPLCVVIHFIVSFAPMFKKRSCAPESRFRPDRRTVRIII